MVVLHSFGVGEMQNGKSVLVMREGTNDQQPRAV